MTKNNLYENLFSSLKKFSTQKKILITSDYDGTIAPIVTDPKFAVAPTETLKALTALANLPNTNVALISGRSRDALIEVSDLKPPIIFVGSHGAEFAEGFTSPIDEEKELLLEETQKYLQKISESLPGSFVERKPISITFHYRRADQKQAVNVINKIKYHFADNSNLFFTDGKKVLEYAAIKASKGISINILRNELKPDAVFFIGDDVTDERGFEVITADTDISVYVGENSSTAKYTVKNTDDVRQIFEYILESRKAI